MTPAAGNEFSGPRFWERYFVSCSGVIPAHSDRRTRREVFAIVTTVCETAGAPIDWDHFGPTESMQADDLHGEFLMFANFDIQTSDLIRDISPNENMIGPRERIEHYFRVGQSALDCIGRSLQMAERSAADVEHILDLPCGHGRVLRYLKAAFPQAEITACDLLQDGVDFCRSTFDAVGVYSATDPTKIPLKSDYFDLIWVGSLFTHLDRKLWHAFLDMFRSCLRRNGLLVFTAHGSVDYTKIIDGKAEMRDWQRKLLRHQFETSGFAYYDYDGTPGYGSSLSSPAWVTAQVAQFSGLRLVLCSERACAGHHDIYSYIRDPDWRMQRPRVTVPDIASTRLQMALHGGKRRTKDLLRPGYHALKRMFRRE